MAAQITSQYATETLSSAELTRIITALTIYADGMNWGDVRQPTTASALDKMNRLFGV